MLDATLQTQLKAYLERLQRPLSLVARLDGSEASAQLRSLLDDIAAASPKVSVRHTGTEVDATSAAGPRAPSFSIAAGDEPARIQFAGLPLGHEFTSLVLALLHSGGHPPKLTPEVISQIKALPGTHTFEVFMSLSCQNCPDVVQALNTMAALNPGVQVTTIDGALFQDEVTRRDIMAVPSIFLNGQPFGQGRMEVEEILAKLDAAGAERKAASQAAALSAEAPYDMLVVGGGPAGAAAAVYAARKGIRTGVLAERFGGQVLDTLAIENYISVPETTGPHFAAALEAQVRQYGVDIHNGQRAKALVPAAQPGGLVELQLDNGATLRTRSLVLATGARWRELGVPGEREYRNRGVAYCPHCDGPLFKGKRVAVIGGGNSGVEAAIDLAGITNEVTLLEFAPALRADAVLVAKLHSLPNVRVHCNVQTSEITGDGQRVNGLRLTHRDSGVTQDIALEGVFVQIGLQPNTEWLKGTVELTRHGEISIDARGQTSVPGVFAAGDATSVPYKQIIIATGAGATAALSAFDHLMRLPVTHSTPAAPIAQGTEATAA